MLAFLLALAQIGSVWTSQSLADHSRLVVIAKPVAVRDTGRKAVHPGLRPDLPVIVMEADFAVLDTLKGALETRRFTLHYYRIDLDEWRRQHPAMPGQPAPGFVNAGTYLTFTANTGVYLLYLRMGNEGWEPTSGDTFPTESVFQIQDGERIAK